MPQILGFIGPILSAVGVGTSFLGGQDQAKQQMQMADLNFQMQQQNIQQQNEVANMQSSIQQQIASNQKATLERNAGVLEQQANVVTTAGAENARRTRQDYAAMLATQRAQIAQSGVADTTGSPLQLLAATAVQEQQAVDQQNFQTESQRRDLFREADNQRTDGYTAGLDILNAQATAGAADLRAQNALTQSSLNLAQAQNSYSAQRTANWAKMLSSFGGVSSGMNDTYNKTGNIWGNSSAVSAYSPY